MTWPSFATYKWSVGMSVRLEEDVRDERYYPEHPLVTKGTEMVVVRFWPHNKVECEFVDERYGGVRVLVTDRHKLQRTL
jgi:hypothetical protein